MDAANDTNMLAAEIGETIVFNDVDDAVIGSAVFGLETANETIASGIHADNVKIVSGGDLLVDQAVVSEETLLLDVYGDLQQSLAGTISTSNLGLTVTGTTELLAANTVEQFAASNDGATALNNIADLVIGTVTFSEPGSEMLVEGVSTTDHEVKISTQALNIHQAIDVGNSNLFLDVDGDIKQAGSGTLSASSLGLVVIDSAELNLNNKVENFSALSGGLLVFNNDSALNIGTIVVGVETDYEISLSGITASDDVKLSVEGDLNINEAIQASGQAVFISATGMVNQSVIGTVSAAELGLMVEGKTALSASNQVEVFAADNHDRIVLNNTRPLEIGMVVVAEMTEFEMSVVGITTSNDDVKISSDGLFVDDRIELGNGIAFFDVAANVNQSSTGAINALALAIESGGATILSAENDVSIFAAETNGLTVFSDLGELEISTVTVAPGTEFEMTLAGIVSTDNDIKLNVESNILLNEQIDAGTANIFATTGGSINQANTAAITASGLGLMVEAHTVLNGQNDVNVIAADNNNDTIYNDVNDLTVDTVIVAAGTEFEMQIKGFAVQLGDIKLTAANGLFINESIETISSTTFLATGGDLTQSSTGTITTDHLGLMIGGETILDAMNDVREMAADNQGQTVVNTVGELIAGTTSVFEGTFLEMSVTGITTNAADVKLSADTLSIEERINTFGGNVLLNIGGNLDQSATGVIIANGLGLMVQGSTILNSNNDLNVLAAQTTSQLLLNDIDDLSIGEVIVATDSTFEMAIAGISILDSDLKLSTAALEIESEVHVGAASVFFESIGDVNQLASGTISSFGLGLIVEGMTTLNANNHVETFAVENTDQVVFSNVSDLSIDAVTVFAGTEFEMSVAGVTTFNADAKISSASLQLVEQISTGEATVFLTADGDLSQEITGIITTNHLGLMTTGSTILDAENEVAVFSADTGGMIVFKDSGILTIAEVIVAAESSFEMILDGIQTEAADVKLLVGDLEIDSSIDVGNANLFIASSGNVNQMVDAIIAANGLGMMVDGTTFLSSANSVETFAANNVGELVYNNLGNLSIGNVVIAAGTPFEMIAEGITTVDSDVKVTTDGNLSLENFIDVANGSVFLQVGNSVSQSTNGTITANQLGLIVANTSSLNAENDINMLALDSGGLTIFHDIDDLTIETATVFGGTEWEMSVEGAKSSGDMKLIAEDIEIRESVKLNESSFFVMSGGNLTQTAAGTIIANQLGLMVSGASILTAANDVDQLAAQNGGTIVFDDIDDLVVGDVVTASMTPFEMTIDGITTESADTKLTADDLSINSAIDVGDGKFFVALTGNIEQESSGTIVASELGMMVTGTTILDAENDVNVFAANNIRQTLFRDMDGFTVGTVIVVIETPFEMAAQGVTTADFEIKLSAGHQLHIDQVIDSGNSNAFFVAGENLHQSIAGTIFTNQLGLMVGGSTILNASNDVNVFAATNGGSIVFNDVDEFTVGDAVVFEESEFKMVANGITTNGSDVKLEAATAIAIESSVNIGSGTLFVIAGNDLIQTEAGTIDARALGLMVEGQTLLESDNNVDIFAADNNGKIVFNALNDLQIGSATVFRDLEFEMHFDGIQNNSDTKLTITNNLTIEKAIAVAQDVFIFAGGSLSQVQTGTIHAAGLGLMVEGDTILDLANDVETFAAESSGLTLFNDIDDLVVGEVVVFAESIHEMRATGIQTDNSDTKVIVGGDLSIEQTIQAGSANAFLVVGGNLSQNNFGSINSNGLGLKVNGDSVLGLENQISILAAENDGFTLLNNIADVNVNSVTVFEEVEFQMALTGIVDIQR